MRVEVDHGQTIVRDVSAPPPGLSVLHVAQPTDAGVPTCVAQLLEEQVERGLRISLACPGRSTLVPRAEALGVKPIDWEAVQAPGVRVPGETRRLARIVDEVDPNIVHLHSSKAGLAGRLAVRGRRPTVFQPNGWSFEATDGLERRGALAWERFAARWAAVVVCVSQDERARGESLGIRAEWSVVPNGVDVSELTPAGEAERSEARARLGLGSGAVVLCIGRLTRQKGQDVLLDAWPDVLARVPEAELVLVGDGPDRAHLVARRVQGVSLVGARDDVADWLAAADVVALPSRWEGMALTMLEAMARGRSVVATDVSGAREALRGEAGAVVPREDPAALAEALVTRLLDRELATTEGARGRGLAERFYDARRAAAAVTDLYAWVYE